MTRLYGIGHALVPMRRTTFAIRHEKADSGGYIAYVTGWGPHILGDVHTRQRASRFKPRCKNTRGVWARITNGDASLVQWDRILKCGQMSRVRAVGPPGNVRRENLWQWEFRRNCLTDGTRFYFDNFWTLLKLDSKARAMLLPDPTDVKYENRVCESFLAPSMSDISREVKDNLSDYHRGGR